METATHGNRSSTTLGAPGLSWGPSLGLKYHLSQVQVLTRAHGLARLQLTCGSVYTHPCCGAQHMNQKVLRGLGR